MSLLSTDDLTYMQDSIEECMPGTCYILSVTNASAGGGEYSETWGTAGTANCRLDARGGGEKMQGESAQPVFSFILTLPHDTTVSNANRIKLDSVTYAITSIDTGKSWNASKRLTLELI